MLQGGNSDSNRIYTTDQIGGIRKRLRPVSISQFSSAGGNQVTNSHQVRVQKLRKRSYMITTHMANTDDANSKRIQHGLNLLKNLPLYVALIDAILRIPHEFYHGLNFRS